ncbi:MAG: hypothetical protein DRO67_01880 [Candidatus Asgardarchaeum californiense]|nr:MAG: hypothetical protein DRO67_01880 [Candidatus Asgardarchaeum californiense]
MDFDLEQYSKQIINQYSGLFDTIKSICNDLINNPNSTDINKYYRYQDQLTGIYGSLNVAYKQLSALKKNKEAEYYNLLKLQADANNEKFVSAVAEKEASKYVAPLRTARDILEGYVEVVVKTIDTCRSHIYEYKKDQKYDV